jgi:hypothetical protein
VILRQDTNRIIMKRGNTTLEYLCLIAFSAAAIIAMVVYMGRGFQGSIRSSADQIGAGQYAPGNTVVVNREERYERSRVVSTSDSTATYGSEDGSVPGSTNTTSKNTEESTGRVIRNTNERLGVFQNDTWR